MIITSTSFFTISAANVSAPFPTASTNASSKPDIQIKKDFQRLIFSKQLKHQHLSTKIRIRDKDPSSCLLTRQKRVTKSGKCLNMFCLVGSSFYQNQVR
jgi:hypothetical protein